MKGFKYLAIILALVASGVTYAYANVARLVLIDYSSFRKILPQTFSEVEFLPSNPLAMSC
tara:strand:+ start:592 stop:771 length:180 start_codon:yes stop_codon:yes gene_type:complete